MKGYIQVYTGNGKGKTTAALGLALRAAGAGKKVYIAQFVKGMKYSELDALEKFSNTIEIHQFGLRCFIKDKPKPEDIEEAQKGLAAVREIIAAGKHDMVILDEANIATYFGLFSAEDLLGGLDKRPEHVEIVITGRYADKKVMDAADLVTEMREVKHYYANGVQARPGIEK